MDVDQAFPFDKYRPHQKEAIIEALTHFIDGKKNVIIEAPTGSGKSAIALTIAKILKSSYYLTIQKMLQSQLMTDFSDTLVDLKGRNSYRCNLIKKHMDLDVGCDKGRCITKGKSRFNDCDCEYFNRLAEAESSPHTLFNFSSFLYQRYMAKRFKDSRKLIICDESHNVEQQIMSFVDVTINGNDFEIEIPEYDDVEQYISYFEDQNILDTISDNINRCRDELNNERLLPEEIDELIRELDKWNGISIKYAHMLEYIDNVDCICEHNKNSVTIKPLRAYYHTPRLLLNNADKSLFMSATILNPSIFSKNIGLKNEETAYVSVPHTFPVENRMVHLDYAGLMDYKNRDKSMPKLINKVDEIMNKHKEDKGIIHCHSFAFMNTIATGLSHKNKRRLLMQTNYKNKEEMLVDHLSRDNSVIIAPAMHEGLDLKGDASRFQIVAKVPYPSFKDNKQLQIRMKEDWSYYLWLTALKLIQSIGRSIRSETDYAATYIVDESFDKFFNTCDNFRLLPDWFVESLVVD